MSETRKASAIDTLVALTRATETLKRSFAEEAQNIGPNALTLIEYSMLQQIVENGSKLTTPSNLTSTGYFGSNLSYNLAELEKKGLIEKIQSPNDRRSRIISITESGLAAYNDMRVALTKSGAERRLLGSLKSARKVAVAKPQLTLPTEDTSLS